VQTRTDVIAEARAPRHRRAWRSPHAAL